MIQDLLYAIRKLFKSNQAAKGQKISCYHCGEKSTPKRTIYVQFNGSVHPVCCNGCAAILKTVEELGMRDEYLAHKIQISDSHE
jgi:hypothetical protein